VYVVVSGNELEFQHIVEELDIIHEFLHGHTLIEGVKISVAAFSQGTCDNGLVLEEM